MDEVFRAKDIANTLGLTTKRIYQLMATGDLPSARIGRRIVVPAAAWREFMASKSHAAIAHMAACQLEGAEADDAS